MVMIRMCVLGVLAVAIASSAQAAPEKSTSVPAGEATAAVAPVYDQALAERVGADERGMRPFVLVILKTGPTRVPDGEARKAMFAGHFANMERLSKAGKLALAGPFIEDASGWRGLFVFAVNTIEEAEQLTATDPVIVNGEMVAEYHRWYGSAATLLIPELHGALTQPNAGN